MSDLAGRSVFRALCPRWPGRLSSLLVRAPMRGILARLPSADLPGGILIRC